jgi:rsbT antagonist protein RsbS
VIERAIPIIRLRDLLIVSIQIALSDQLVAALKDDIADALADTDARGLVIEVSGVDVFDSYIASSISDIAGIARFMGVDTILAGLDASMAITLVEMGLELEGVRTALDLDMAVRMIGESTADKKASDRALIQRLLGLEVDLSSGSEAGDPQEVEPT